ncbi:MAG TPA: DUF4239 domain-containing protein [Burkholderiaceae bacterium]|jgi:hypothetical protein|nr:DUF4239 domain-containing protein [Burkholderiaceae bacterium]
MHEFGNFLVSLPVWGQALVFMSITLVAGELIARVTQRLARGLDLGRELTVTVAVYTVVGTTYGILLSFAVSLVWGENSGAATAVSNEAQALSQLHRSAGFTLAQPYAGEAQALARNYAQTVVEREWPELRRHEFTHTSRDAANRLADFAGQIPQTAAANPASYMMFQGHVTRWLEARQQRLTAGITDLPRPMWGALVLGALVLFSFHGALVTQTSRARYLLLVPLAMIIGVQLCMVFTLDRPYAGAFAVDPQPFIDFIDAMR